MTFTTYVINSWLDPFSRLYKDPALLQFFGSLIWSQGESMEENNLWVTFLFSKCDRVVVWNNSFLSYLHVFFFTVTQSSCVQSKKIKSRWPGWRYLQVWQSFYLYTFIRTSTPNTSRQYTHSYLFMYKMINISLSSLGLCLVLCQLGKLSSNTFSFHSCQIHSKSFPLFIVFVFLFFRIGSATKMVCYFTNWSQYRPGEGKYMPQNVDPFLCTTLIYAFSIINQNNELVTYEWNDDVLYKSFNNLKTK